MSIDHAMPLAPTRLLARKSAEPADGDDDQQHDRAGGEREIKQQLVRLLVGGRAVVARHLDVEAGGREGAPDKLQPLQRVGGDVDGVLALALGDGEAHRGAAVELP